MQQILEEILKRERSAQQYGNVIHKRLHGPHPWAILWKSSFWLVSVCVAYHMFMYAQYLVSGSAVIWGLRALLTYIFYKVADFTIDRGLSWRSVMILGYTLGAYYLFLGIRERFSAGIMRFFAHWIAITFFVVAGAFSYAWFIFDDSVPWGHESFEGVSPDERFEAYQHFERERQERADAWARHGDPPQTERSARKNSWKQSERSKRRQNKGRKKKV